MIVDLHSTHRTGRRENEKRSASSLDGYNALRITIPSSSRSIQVTWMEDRLDHDIESVHASSRTLHSLGELIAARRISRLTSRQSYNRDSAGHTTSPTRLDRAGDEHYMQQCQDDNEDLFVCSHWSSESGSEDEMDGVTEDQPFKDRDRVFRRLSRARKRQAHTYDRGNRDIFSRSPSPSPSNGQERCASAKAKNLT